MVCNNVQNWTGNYLNGKLVLDILVISIDFPFCPYGHIVVLPEYFSKTLYRHAGL